MKIHAIQTGTVALTSAWRVGVGHGRRRLLHAITDGEWTEPPPIYAFAIEHLEGVIVVDTGEDARASQRTYLARWHPGLRAFSSPTPRSVPRCGRHACGRVRCSSAARSSGRGGARMRT